MLLRILLLSLVTSSVLAQTGDYRHSQNAKPRADQTIKPNASDGAWMVAPIPISNPTLGTGLQAAALYLHESKGDDTPNATSGIGGMYTDNGSYYGALFHDDYWQNDKYRFTGFVGTGKLQLNYYLPGFESFKIGYELKNVAAHAKFAVRIPKTEHWFTGLQYTGTKSTVYFDLCPSCADSGIDIPKLSSDIVTSGVGVLLTYDHRDNNYYPTKGHTFTTTYSKELDSLGSDYDYTKLESKYTYYVSLAEKHVLALKTQLKDADGTTPFFMKPTLSMRGFDTSKYRDNSALSFHAEWRYKFAQRWGLVVFHEEGMVAPSINDLFDGRKANSTGAGIRWQATKSKAMNLGIDVAYSDGESEIHIRAGEFF